MTPRSLNPGAATFTPNSSAERLADLGTRPTPRLNDTPPPSPLSSPHDINRGERSWDNALWLLGNGSANPLQMAIVAGDLKLVARRIADGDDVHARNENGYTALHLAAGMGHTDLIVALHSAGAALGVRCKAGNTPLMIALERDQTATATLLALLMDNIDARNDAGLSAADLARDRGNVIMQNVFHKRGVPDADAGRMRFNDVLAAIDRHDVRRVFDLTMNAHPSELIGEDSITPMHVAAKKGDVTMLRVLMAANQSPNTIDVCGRTPLDLAKAANHTEAIAYLEARGALAALPESPR